MSTSVMLLPDCDGGSGDRRSSRRYRLALPVACRSYLGRALGESEAGLSVDISSRGIRFLTGAVLRPGARVELSVHWPLRLDNRCALQLRLRGTVVRCDPGGVAVEVVQHEFRTRGGEAAAADLATSAAGLTR